MPINFTILNTIEPIRYSSTLITPPKTRSSPEENTSSQHHTPASALSPLLRSDLSFLSTPPHAADQFFKKKQKFFKKNQVECIHFLKKIQESAKLSSDDELGEAAAAALKQMDGVFHAPATPIDQIIESYLDDKLGQQALETLNGDCLASAEIIDQILESYLNVCLLGADRDAKGDKLEFTSITTLKHVDKIDRLLGRKGKELSHLYALILNQTLPLSPTVLEESQSGTANASYFVSEKAGKKQMFFKPRNTEKRIFSMIGRGAGFKRQVLAYLLDRKQGGLAGVPLSLTAQEEHLGLGSIQTFRKTHGDLTSLYSKDIEKISIPSFQNNALLRLRMYDLDAHLGNFLWKKEASGEITLIPIDFDYSLPLLESAEDVREASLKLGIGFFPQADMPLEKDVMDSLLHIDSSQEAEVLASLGYSPREIALLKHTTYTLQAMAKSGCTLGEMIDELSSASFKETVVETEPDRATVEERVKGLLASNRELAEKRKIAIDEIIAGSTENATYRARVLFEDDKDLRGALKIIYQLLEQFPEDKALFKAIDYFKGVYASDPNRLYAFFIAIALKMDQVGLTTKSTALRKWLFEEA